MVQSRKWEVFIDAIDQLRKRLLVGSVVYMTGGVSLKYPPCDGYHWQFPESTAILTLGKRRSRAN